MQRSRILYYKNSIIIIYGLIDIEGVKQMNVICKISKYIYCNIKLFINNHKSGSQYMYTLCKSCCHCIRLPKNKGKFIVTCPECGETAEVET